MPDEDAGARCLEPDDAATVVSLTASDGVPLRGALMGDGPDGVLAVHELGTDLCSWLPVGRRLRDEGYRVLLLDARWHGGSARPAKNTHAWDLDVVAAVDYLRQNGVEDLVLAGGSYGATTVTWVAPAIEPPVAGVVNASGGYGFRTFDIRKVAPELDMPLLFMAAAADGSTAGAAEDVVALAPAADKEVAVVAGNAHGAEMFEGATAEEAYTALLAFVARVTDH